APLDDQQGQQRARVIPADGEDRNAEDRLQRIEAEGGAGGVHVHANTSWPTGPSLSRPSLMAASSSLICRRWKALPSTSLTSAAAASSAPAKATGSSDTTQLAGRWSMPRSDRLVATEGRPS